MLFNSLDFAIFLPIVFGLYWLVKDQLKLQNLLVALASYFFYGFWDWRFLSLIFISTVLDYVIGIQLSEEEDHRYRKRLLWLSVFVNLGFLGFFKYCNFFIDNFVAAFSFFGMEIQSGSLDIILPVGISFYTFQTLSYTIDVYKKRLEPTRDFVAFAAFVGFFPQLVAGPIERAKNLLPQFYTKRHFDFDNAMNGMNQIIWGLFKKVVIADNCAEYANLIFDNPQNYDESTLALGALFFTFQIYGDFSGYSDIAIGTAKLFGFNLMKNFSFPYFSRDIAEFWRRWHISLSTWFRDYLYIPLGGSRGNKWFQIRNVFIIFIVSGFWHGAKWTFIVWGLLNAIYFLPLLLLNKNRQNLDIVAKGKHLPSPKEFIGIIITFSATMIAWVFFRAENIGQALAYLYKMLSFAQYDPLDFHLLENAKAVLGYLVFFISIEWMGRSREYATEGLNGRALWLRFIIFYFIIMSIIVLGSNKVESFIYFQF